jgi:hypothetical protein
MMNAWASADALGAIANGRARTHGLKIGYDVARLVSFRDARRGPR